MDINILLQRLRSGESYTVHNTQGELVQETRPPTPLNQQAARTIAALHQQAEQSNQAMLNIQAQLLELAQQYELLQSNKPAT